MTRPDTTSAEFFDRTYADADDPWRFATSPYELGRYRAILDHVPHGRYRRAFEPGCSIGVLTARLAERCGTVHATDLSPIAVDRARRRCADLPGVTVTVGTLVPPTDDGYDLAVLSEVGYYHTIPDLDRHATIIEGAIATGGRLVAVHWLGHSADHLLHADDVHHTLAHTFHAWHHTHHAIATDPVSVGYRIDVWDKP